MTVARFPHPASAYAWSLVLPHPRDRTGLAAQALNASEQMFFFGAPLAHVVLYEEHLRAIRQEKAIRQQARTPRSFNFATQLAGLRELPTVRGELAHEG